ncbi:MAG TPA: S8 family serine peptidase [Blastocatellia bacterium]|nr:S8 family serine peptidase [Blastocatellia bacterium]
MYVTKRHTRVRRTVAVALLLLLIVSQVQAGLTITQSSGIATTGADGISFINTSGIATTGADGFLAFGPNGIATTGADGLLPIQVGPEGITFTGPNGIATTGADGIAVTGADGIAVTGADGIAVTGADGNTINAITIQFTNPNGIAVTGADGTLFRDITGIATTGADSFVLNTANGIIIHGAQGIAVTGADGATITLPDGSVASISPNGIAVTGADGIAVTGADGINVTGATGIQYLNLDAITNAANAAENAVGLQGLDPELAVTLNNLTDDSNVNAIVVYHHLPTDSDISDLTGLGVLGGTRYHALPMINVTATKHQIIDISHLPAVRSIYGVRTLQLSSDPYLAPTVVDRVATDQDLTNKNHGMPLSGHGVTVAVLDTGVDGTHPDLAGRVVQNVKLADTESLGVGFTYPIDLENLPDSDLVYGHGTFVAGVVAGNGQSSGGRYAGVAPGANILGLSAGDLTLTFVLSGFDYILQHASQYNVRVVNCSFSASTVFDFNDPVNIATKMLTDSGINVVFSAGNSGPGDGTSNPYAVAPWVISVGATDQNSHLASFSSRGSFGSSLFKPTIVAPGTSLIGLRALGITGVEGLLGSDLSRLSLGDLLRYTTGSGTSFSAPQVAATVALMLEANPNLQPAQIRDILQNTATPLPNYYQHQVGAGMLNVYAATLEAAFPQRQFGLWRSVLDGTQFINDPLQTFSGSVTPGSNSNTSVTIPANTIQASVKIGWGPLTSLNDLGLNVIDPNGKLQATSNAINLPGLTGKEESVTLSMPAAGNWTAQAFNSLGSLGTTQAYSGSLQVSRVQYPVIRDLLTVSNSAQNDILQVLRTFEMAPVGSKFFPGFSATRSGLAMALVSSGSVSQYLAASPHYQDVTDVVTRNAVESVQLRPSGPMFPESTGCTTFRPNAAVDRLTAAIVLVRAAGLQSEAQNWIGLLTVGDTLSIPSQWRGYVAVALKHGLMTPNNNLFAPNGNLTRADLAHALVVLQQLQSQ